MGSLTTTKAKFDVKMFYIHTTVQKLLMQPERWTLWHENRNNDETRHRILTTKFYFLQKI